MDQKTKTRLLKLTTCQQQVLKAFKTMMERWPSHLGYSTDQVRYVLREDHFGSRWYPDPPWVRNLVRILWGLEARKFLLRSGPYNQPRWALGPLTDLLQDEGLW
jgi:hypothetical protein